jgi:hypothetical protein
MSPSLRTHDPYKIIKKLKLKLKIKKIKKEEEEEQSTEQSMK